MAPPIISAWLRRWRRRQCAYCLLLSGLALLAGVGALFVLFCFIWVLSLLVDPGAMARQHLVVTGPLILTLFAAGLLFIDSLFSHRDDLSNVIVWLVRETFGIGPRLLLESFRQLRRAVHFAVVDVDRCAEVLGYVISKQKSVPKDELLKVFPDLNWSWLRSQLRLLQGVVFLRADFSRIGLTQPFRLRLRQLVKPQEQAASGAQENREPPPPVTEPETLTSYEILGVSAAASIAEIKLAYRRRIKECHPDRFGELDPASRQQAEEWTIALNAAYDALMAQHSRRQ